MPPLPGIVLDLTAMFDMGWLSCWHSNLEQAARRKQVYENLFIVIVTHFVSNH